MADRMLVQDAGVQVGVCVTYASVRESSATLARVVWSLKFWLNYAVRCGRRTNEEGESGGLKETSWKVDIQILITEQWVSCT